VIPRERSRKAAKEADMIDSVIFTLIYGPILVTLACWFIFTVEARRAKKDVVIYVLSQKRHRLHRGAPAADCSDL
jgi:hypothetical protein